MSYKRLGYYISNRKPWGRIGLPLTMALLILLSGCMNEPKLSSPVHEPPLIPEIPVKQEYDPASETTQALFVGTYADLAEWNDPNKYHIRLREAISTAIRLEILRPTNLQERFEPRNPIRYDEFRKWTIAYQSAASGMDMLPVNAQGEQEHIKDLTPIDAKIERFTNPMNPGKLMIPPSEMAWDEHRISTGHTLTRQDLCALYVFLTHQEEAARKLSPDEIESANPSKDSVSLDEALSQFKDYTGIEPWARRYVAIAYRDGMLQKIFGLTPNRLTIEEGFNSKQPIQRSEAIVLLHDLYGATAISRIKSGSPTKASTNSNTTSSAGIKNTSAQTGKAADQPVPPAHLKSFQEAGPAGARSALQIQGPD